jgi:sterol desaturase/sphingolipid hydroxylase (fatty acid hydroxylase superfamily)
VLVLLGFSSDAVFAFTLFELWLGLGSHVGVDTHNPWLDRVLVTPRTHRVHHSRKLSEAGNYGLLLTVWDRVFGTYVPPTVDAPALGLSEPAEFPSTWWGILLLRRPKPSPEASPARAVSPS